MLFKPVNSQSNNTATALNEFIAELPTDPGGLTVGGPHQEASILSNLSQSPLQQYQPYQPIQHSQQSQSTHSSQPPQPFIVPDEPLVTQARLLQLAHGGLPTETRRSRTPRPHLPRTQRASTTLRMRKLNQDRRNRARVCQAASSMNAANTSSGSVRVVG
jgi:hypothetical protein